MDNSKSGIRRNFFDLLFADYEGYVCIATTEPNMPRASFRQKFFEWPREALKVEHYLLTVEKQHNVYFCVNLLSKMERRKENCLDTDIIWADLDEANPKDLKVQPTVTIVTSPGRFQALWRLTTKVAPELAEEYSRRIAYSCDADKSGWDLGQLLRVPFTTNFKYKEQPTIQLAHVSDKGVKPLLLEAFPTIQSIESKRLPVPLPDDLPQPQEILYKYQLGLKNRNFLEIYSAEPSEDGDWSRALWYLINLCFEAGMSAEEVFAITKDAPCNKYKRDGRPDTHLWRDIIKAETARNQLNLYNVDPITLTMPQMVDGPTTLTFLDTYSDWAKEVTDAVVQFHDLSAMILLSSIIANYVRLEAAYGVIVPNLWGMILGESTVTRKSTAMRMPMDMLLAIDSEIIMATDGSPEGLLSGLSSRPNKVSIFYKDELSGFFTSINNKDYLAGMPETLTHLYDVRSVYNRRLRKEVIRIENAAFVFFGGGIADKVYEYISEDYITSGFMPRFLIIAGEGDVDNLRPTGPPTETSIAKRTAVTSAIHDLYETYATDVTTKIGAQHVLMPARIMAIMTDKAWAQYAEYEKTLLTEANKSPIPNLANPTFGRLARSLLKMAIIFGAARQQPTAKSEIEITDVDVKNAAWYIQEWGKYSIELILNAGTSEQEKDLSKIVRLITNNPGILRGQIMRVCHLNKHKADLYLDTLEQQMVVRKEKSGRGYRYWLY